ncbi:MAG: hypothetical protein AAF843_10800 [Bacteroidota bacterium]
MKYFAIIKFSIISILISSIFLMTGCGDDDDPINPGDPSISVDAGEDQTVAQGELVTLSGTASEATGEDLILLWEFTSRPTGSTAAISNPALVSTSFRPDLAGSYTVRLTASTLAGASNSDELIITVEEGDLPLEVPSSISSELTLENVYEDPNQPDYIVNGIAFVNARLIIDPGVTILFGSGASLSIGTEGNIRAEGTFADSIIFTGVEEVAGYWRGIDVASKSSANLFELCRISYAGSGTQGANLTVLGNGEVNISRSTIRHSEGYGIRLESGEAEIFRPIDNVITNNFAPILIDYRNYEQLNPTTDYSGNTNDYIDTYSNSGGPRVPTTWSALNIPYRLPASVIFIESAVTIEAGASFLARPESGIAVESGGSLNAVGTATDPIRFEGAQDVRGYWRGLKFETNDINNELTHVIVSNGGQGSFDGSGLKTNVIVQRDARIKITNTTLTKSDGFGLYWAGSDLNISEFSNNTITDNDTPMRTNFYYFAALDSESDFAGNDNDYIDTEWAGGVPYTENVTWQALNVPYRLIGSVETIGGNIEIEAGAEFLGQPASRIIVATSGSLKAVGTSQNRIIFRGERDEVGYWFGLSFLSNDMNNVFEHVTVSNGGEEGITAPGVKSNIEVSGRLDISNSTINKSGGAGIRVLSGGTLISNNLSFEPGGNTEDNIIQ